MKKALSYLAVGAVFTWLKLQDYEVANYMAPYWKDYKDGGLLAAVVSTIIVVIAWPVFVGLTIVDMVRFFGTIGLAIFKHVK